MSRRRPPIAPRLDLVDNIHGRLVPDPYRWLENPDDARTRDWNSAQDALFRHEQQSWAGLDRLVDRFAELMSAGNMSLPRPRGGRMFYARRDPGRDHPILYVRESDATERALLDPIAIDPTGTTTVEHFNPSVDGGLLTYQIARGGAETGALHIIDVDTGKPVDEKIERVRRSPVAWLPDGSGFYYVRPLHPDLVPAGERHYHRRVCLHQIGTSADSDVVVFGEGRDKADFYGVTLSVDGRWLTVSVTAGTSQRTDVWLADLAESDASRPKLRPVQQEVDARTIVYIRKGTTPTDPIYLLTNRGAPRGRIAVSTPDELDRGDWADLVPEDPDAVIADLAVLDGPEMTTPTLLVVRNRHAVSEITVHDLSDGRPMATIPLPGLGAVTHLVDRTDGGHEAWFSYTDFTTPHGVFRYDGRTGQTRQWDNLPVPAVPPIRTLHVTYPSTDGTTVRMFVLSTTGIPDRPRPTIINGYGGFGVTVPADYNPVPLAWVEAGGVYVVAHLRGGAEEGESWHRAGMRDRKRNSFDDLHAAADWLVHNGWTTPGQLGIFGGSNGGLLVGAALTQHPEKYAAVVCSAPLLDMVRYERSGFGPSWVQEYGSAADPEQLDWLLSYSPYHHVAEAVAYPAVLFTVFDGDTRVDPLHARKMCAALQHATSSGRPVLIRAEGGVGHSYRAVSRGIGVLADTLAFFAAHLGLRLPTGRPEPIRPESPLDLAALSDARSPRATSQQPPVLGSSVR